MTPQELVRREAQWRRKNLDGESERMGYEYDWKS